MRFKLYFSRQENWLSILTIKVGSGTIRILMYRLMELMDELFVISLGLNSGLWM